ncbi:uncharacterized protein LOC117870553 [Trachemys scripta elegans]|uniref:uncharacterized protein LOC117870553 n=1 Tax=Trachemys scripta elegans TaxID=31138 RepID=UPI001551AADD|nr:uncharacterized protein LOC117870553 [Trachemys scripta elegans]
MLIIRFSLVTMALVFKGATGVSVTQTKGPVSVSEGEGLRLSCSYDAAVYAVFWYVHLPSQPPRLLLRDLGRDDSDEGIRKGFDATHDKKNKSFQLWKPSSELSDSATYYCAASDTVTRSGRGAAQKPRRVCAEHRGAVAPGRAEIQQPGSAEALEGAELNLTCSQPSTEAGDSTVWYRQLPNPGPQFAVTGYKETVNSPEPAGALHISAEREPSPLALSPVRRGDAAVYFCARRDTVGHPAAAPFWCEQMAPRAEPRSGSRAPQKLWRELN